MSDLVRLAEEWRDQDPDPETRAELDAILERDDRAELEARFGAKLEFGTAACAARSEPGPTG